MAPYDPTAARDRRLLRKRADKIQRVQNAVHSLFDELPVRDRVVALHEIVKDVLRATENMEPT